MITKIHSKERTANKPRPIFEVKNDEKRLISERRSPTPYLTK